ncbi:MAG: NifU family protein [Halarchaeum sp.]
MSEARDADGDDDFHGRVERWLTAQMPIIQMHGGESAVRKADPDDGEVVIELGGACSGCGISPRTAHRIKTSLADDFDAVTDVTVRFTDDSGSDWTTGQPESYMGIDRNEGGRGGRGEGSPDSDGQHF